MRPNSSFRHWTKKSNFDCHGRKVYIPKILLHTSVCKPVTPCRTGRYSRDMNHSSPWLQMVYTHFAQTSHSYTYILLFGLWTVQALKIQGFWDVKLCRFVNSSWHLERTTILRDIGNYLPSENNIHNNPQQFCYNNLKSHRIHTDFVNTTLSHKCNSCTDEWQIQTNLVPYLLLTDVSTSVITHPCNNQL